MLGMIILEFFYSVCYIMYKHSFLEILRRHLCSKYDTNVVACYLGRIILIMWDKSRGNRVPSGWQMWQWRNVYT